MRFSLPELGNLRASRAAIPARRVVQIRADGTAEGWKLGLRWNGRLKLASAPLPAPGAHYILAIDPARVFRRRIAAGGARIADIGALAESLFPFPPGEARFALADMDGDLVVGALLEADAAALEDRFGRPQAAIVAAGDGASILAALSTRFSIGKQADFVRPAVRLLRPATALAGVYLLLAGLGLGLSFNVSAWREDAELAGLRQQAAKIEREIAPLVHRRDASLRMAESLAALAAFERESATRALTAAGAVLSDMPAGGFVERLELRPDAVVVIGYAKDPLAWLARHGALADDVKIAPMPLYDRYEATVRVALPTKEPKR